MLMDEIFENMVDTLKDAKRVAKTASPLPLSTAQFELLDNTNGEIDVSLSKTHFKRNVVATGYDSQDKAILKEKGRAIEVGDITEQAHPETAVVAENYKGSGEVENQNEQHAKIVDSINRMPTGFNFNTFASAIQELVKIAEQLDQEGDLRASARVMQGVVRLSNLKKKELAKSAISPDELAAADAAQIAKHRLHQPELKAAPVKTPEQSMENNPTAPAAAKPAPANRGTVRMPPIPSDDAENPKAKKPYSSPGIATAPAAANNPTNVKQPEMKVVRHTDVEQGGYGQRQQSVTRPDHPVVAKGGRFRGYISSILNSLKGNKGKIGLVAAIATGVITTVLISSNDEAASPIGSLAKSENSQVAQIAENYEQSFAKAIAESENGNLEEALNHLEVCQDQIEDLASLATTTEEQESVDEMRHAWSHMESGLNAAMQKAAAETGQTIMADRERMKSLQSFFKEHYDPNMPVTGVSNSRLKDISHKFIEKVNNDLGVAPRLFTVENLLLYGTGPKLEEIKDIWTRPHLHVDRALMKN